MRNLSLAAALAIVPALLAGCQAAPSTVAAVEATVTVAASPATSPTTTPAIPCGHPVVAAPAFTAEEDYFPKGAPARRYVNNFAMLRAADGQVGLNPLFPSFPSRTKHPAFNGKPFNIIVSRAVGNAVTIRVPKGLAPYRGTPINGIDSSAASVAKYLPPIVGFLDSVMLGPISTMRLGQVRHADASSVYADENGCYYLDLRGNSWRDQIGNTAEVAIKRTPQGFNVVSATAKWQAFYPAKITKGQGVAASPDAKQTVRPAALPRPALPKCLNQYSYPIKPLTGRLVGSSPVCVMVGISYRNLKDTAVTLTVHTPSCGPQPPVATAFLQGTGSKTLLVVKPGCGSDDSYSIHYSQSLPKDVVRIRAATQSKD